MSDRFVSVVYHSFSPVSEIHTKNVKLCKDCKHFFTPPHQKNLKFGKCRLFGDINLIDGDIEYKYAGGVRSTECKGKYYEE